MIVPAPTLSSANRFSIMTDFVFPPIPQASVAVRGSRQRYAVGRIFCVGRNYAAHAREMGGNPDREPPFFFNKAPAHLLASGATVPYPPGTRDYHHEMELVVAIGQPAFRIAPEQGQACVWGYACGLDMTRRDLQGEAKKAGRPWSFGKDFEHAAVIGELVPASQTGAGPRAHRAGRQRPDAPAGRPGRPDLERARGRRQPVAVLPPAAGRSDLHRHARRCGRGAAGRRAGRAHRGRGRNP
jgi:hypothetical protein